MLKIRLKPFFFSPYYYSDDNGTHCIAANPCISNANCAESNQKEI